MMLSISEIIIFCLIAFSLLVWKFPSWLPVLSEYPYRIVHEKKIYQIITGHFVHANWIHLLFNVMTLYSFGPAMETILGGKWFLIVYIISHLTGSLTVIIYRRNQPGYSSVGASAAIVGIVYCYMVFYPLSSLYLFFIPVGIPAFLLGSFFLIFTIWGMRTSYGHLSHESHLGGAIFGLLAGLVFRWRYF